ncbi:acyl carrier protein [Streptomyces sp. 4N509B]|uniref:acyl carrier protein n=1 Tax=Streptomyces sp. 4N509B TaxID=3457413 RepID=UPI003FD2546E
MSDVTTRVTGILVKKFDLAADAAVGGATLEELDFDSLNMVELATALEKELGVAIDEEELSGEHTVADLLSILDGKLNGTLGAAANGG